MSEIRNLFIFRNELKSESDLIFRNGGSIKGRFFWFDFEWCGYFVLQNKIQSLAGQHTDVLESLSPIVRKRVDFLRDIQACFLILKEE